MATLHEISAEGDVKLICGSEKEGDAMHIIVSSVVLRHGSPVFKAMLGSKFKEGHTLATGARLDLPLPDDDAASMLTICQIMHMRPVAPGVQTSEEFLKVAILINKYDCKVALAYQTTVWLQGQQLRRSDSDRLNLFIAAYVLDSPEDFTRLGHDVVLKNNSISLPLRPLGIDTNLKSTILGLQTHVTIAKKHAASRFDTIMKNECTGVAHTNTGYKSCALSGCSYVPKRSYNFMEKLIESGLWPITAFHTRTLQSTCEALLSFPGGWSEGLTMCNPFCRKAQMKKDQDVVTDMKEIAETIKRQAIRPCLACIKETHMQIQGYCDRGHRV